LQCRARPIGYLHKTRLTGIPIVWGGFVMTPIAHQVANRRRFLKFLAASPLLAGTSLSVFAQEGTFPERQPDPFVWAPRDYQHLITDPKEALDVFDFEPVMHKNVPPAHFGYMASGVDDDVTLRANREGFLKFQLRPRRLVDVSKVDMRTEILGTAIRDSPIIIAPTGGHKAYNPDGEEGVAKAAKAGDHLMILSTQSSTDVEDVIKARGAPIWMQLYATNKFEVAADHVRRAEKAGCTGLAVTVDRSGGRNQETLFRLRRSTPGDVQRLPRQFAPASRSAVLHKPLYEGRRSVGAQAHIKSSAHDLGLPQAAARPDKDENGDQRHARPGKTPSSPPPPGSTPSSCPIMAARRRRFRPLDHRVTAGDRRSRRAPCRS
jgi:hypothetical protein